MKEAKPRDFKVFLKKENVNYYTNLSGVKLYDEEVPLNELYYHQGNQDKIRLLENRKGKWNEKAECYTLNMKKRAKKASIKNFILEETSNPEYNCLLLGKVKDNSFNLDVSFPLTPFLAFCIGLTTFVSKIGCWFILFIFYQSFFNFSFSSFTIALIIEHMDKNGKTIQTPDKIW